MPGTGINGVSLSISQKLVIRLRISARTPTESVDYPDFIFPAAKAVAEGKFERGIVLGGSGNGEAMAANRIKGIRCAVCWNEKSARLASLHNNANMISLGERMISIDDVYEIIDIWLNTPFEGGRHARRIEKLDQ